MTGPQTIDGLTYYFDSNGRQVKGERRKVNGKSYFYDPDNGVLVTNRLVTFKAGRFIPEENYAKEIRFDFAPYANYDNNEHPELERYYFGADGLPVTGWQTINGNKYYFQDDGNMVVHRFFNNYYFYSDGTIARNIRLNIPTHYIMREFPNIYEFDNDGVGKYISSDFKDLDLRALIFLKIKRATGTTTMSMDNLVLVPKLLMATTCISILELAVKLKVSSLMSMEKFTILIKITVER